MKGLKYLILFVLILTLAFFGMIISGNVLNSDLYGRLIETEPFHLINTEKEHTKGLPTITLILHKHVGEENSIEASLALNYDKQEVFQSFKTDTLEFMIRLIDGYAYSPTGITNTSYFTDSIKRTTDGYLYSGFETSRFLIPIAPSLNGFPFDDIQIRPMIDLYVNGMYSKLNFAIQKRIPGRIFSSHSEKDKEVVLLTRTSTEKYLVMISSVIFLLLTLILTYGLVTTKKGLNTLEELIAVAGYILATAGFKEIVGISRNNGTSALEIVVILIPLLSVFSGLIFSLYKAKRTK